MRAILLAMLMTMPACAKAQTAGDYVADPASHCKIWWAVKNPQYDSIKAVRWNGACARGMAQGRGIFEVREQHLVYGDPVYTTWTGEGDFSDGKLGGRGFVVADYGRRYEGEFRDGVLNGRGIVTFEKDGHKQREESEYRDGKKNGWGVEDAEWVDGGRTFFTHKEGEWRDDKLHGRGVFVEGVRGCRAEFRYEGEWKRDEWDGRGTLKAYDGKVYSGVWTEDRMGDLSRTQFSYVADHLAKLCR